jgi:hypothetical protein
MKPSENAPSPVCLAILLKIGLLLAPTSAGTTTVQVTPSTDVTGSIQAAAQRAAPGDTILIQDGIYRETVQVGVNGTADNPIVIKAASGAHPVITGADPLISVNWTQVGSQPIWRYQPWSYHAPARSLGDPPHNYVSEQVVEDGQLLRRANSLDTMKSGTFFADPIREHALFVRLRSGDSPRQHQIEASVRPQLMEVSGNNVVVRGLTFRFASNNAQQPAFRISGKYNLAEDCTIEYTSGEGAALDGEGNVFHRVTSRNNGQIGMGGHGQDNSLIDCQLEGNNTLGFPKDWEAGGIKVAASRFHIRRSTATHNDGPGFWFDIDNRDGSVEESWATDNNGPGIMIEISSDMTVRNNVCLRNGLKDERGAWNNAGILLAEAMRTLVDHNVSAWNRTGIEIRQQSIRTLPADRSNGRPSPLSYSSDALTLTHNISAYNREWQFALFGDNDFFRGKRRASREELELLDPDRRLWRVSHNLFFASPGSGLILWGAPWQPRHQAFLTVQDFQNAHQLGQQSIIAPPEFVSPEAGDFTVQSHSAARTINAGLESGITVSH